MLTAYYNEIDPYAAQWLRNLIEAGFIPAGDVDERSIIELSPGDVRGYTQCHFFAGIGGWPHALRLSGWPDDCAVWSGSCPCQPISSAGQRKGHADERHLWPAFYSLISECAPPIVFGEQVANGDGREWFAGVRADLEAVGYACGGADLCAASVGAPQARQRIFWVAHSIRSQVYVEHSRPGRHGGQQGQPLEPRPEALRPQDRETRNNNFARLSPFLWPLGPSRVSEIPRATDGFRNRIGQLRALGNAIVPQVAAEFIIAYRECQP